MQIDGKNITKLGQPNAVTKKDNKAPAEPSKGNGEIGQASDFALSHGAIDQTQRLSNDKVTQLQSRKQALEDGVERLEKHSGNEAEVATEIKNSGLFSGTQFEQKIDKFIAGDNAGASIQQTLKAEINEVSQGISQEVHINARSDDQPEKLIQELRERLRDNPQAFQLAHMGSNAETVNGLLGNTAA